MFYLEKKEKAEIRRPLLSKTGGVNTMNLIDMQGIHYPWRDAVILWFTFAVKGQAALICLPVSYICISFMIVHISFIIMVCL